MPSSSIFLRNINIADMMMMVEQKEIMEISRSCEFMDSVDLKRMHVFSSRPTKTSFEIHSVKKQKYEKTITKKLFKKQGLNLHT